jgi:exonuclease III
MKILTWNLERLKKRKNKLILEKLTEIDADILILTETNTIINPGVSYNAASTDPLPNQLDKVRYHSGERRVTIWTKYKITAKHKTIDDLTSVCLDIQTPAGLLTVFGTIIGVYNGKGKQFDDDLQRQLPEFGAFSAINNICIAGDFNVAFSGYAYPSHKAIQTLTQAFIKLGLTNTTSSINDSVCHIVLSNSFVNYFKQELSFWNEEKHTSDHIGICLTLL